LRYALIIIILTAITGCRTSKTISGFSQRSNIPVDTVIRNVFERNISEQNFCIEKGSIVLRKENIRTKFLFNLKYRKPGTYMISLKSSTGIEGVRMFINEDTILINDRIGKRMLYGSVEEMERIYGISLEEIKILFGDVIRTKEIKQGGAGSERNTFLVTQSIKGRLIGTTISKEVEKATEAVLINSLNQEEIKISYMKYRNTMNRFPAYIYLKDNIRKFQCEIRVERIVIPWNGEIDFIPGKGYKIEKIR
jgi:hypothetical protein